MSHNKVAEFLSWGSVYFRPLEKTDIDAGYLNWINDYDVNKYLYSGKTPVSREELEKYLDKVKSDPNTIMFAVAERDSRKYIGNVKLGLIDWINRTASYGRLIGDSEARDKGHGANAARLLLYYGFQILNLNKITAGVVSDNIAAVQSNQKVGLEIEGIQKEQVFMLGSYRDVTKMGITKTRYLDLYPDGPLSES